MENPEEKAIQSTISIGEFDKQTNPILSLAVSHVRRGRGAALIGDTFGFVGGAIGGGFKHL